MTVVFKPLDGCPLCTSALVVTGTNIHTGDFIRPWTFQAFCKCSKCGCVITIESESRKPEAVAAFLGRDKLERERLLEIGDVERKLAALFDSEPLDMPALERLRDRRRILIAGGES